MKRTVTLIGSYRKDPAKLQNIFSELSSKFELLVPQSIDFVDVSEEFVKAPHEVDRTIKEIEDDTLEAIRQSDFVWLFAPSGYVGTSASFELGFAYSIGVPVFTDVKLQDSMLETMVTDVVADLGDIPTDKHNAGKGVTALQRYYKRIASRRGWSDESAKDTMLLLTEEIGELARAIRKSEGLKRAGGYADVSLLDELADVQLYLVHLANGLGVELEEAVTQKEKKNQQRHQKSVKE